MNRQNKKKGYWFDDEFQSFIKGFYAYKSTYRDARKLSIEIDRVSNNLFAERRRADRRYFLIEHINPVVVNDLTDYFLEDYSRHRDRLYGQYFSLTGFFSGIMHLLLVYGECFSALDWEEKIIEDRKYILPSDFRYLNNSSMLVLRSSKDTIKGYKQKYSLFSRVRHDPTVEKASEFDFRKDEIFYTVYPLDNEHPVKKSMKLLKPILRFWDYMLEEAEANAQTGDHRLDLEIARFLRYSEQKRKYALARARVRKNFHYLLDLDNLTITEYYDIYWVTRYKKELNQVREYFVEEFNNQILIPFAKKNKISPAPVLKLQGFMTNNEIEAYFEDYKSKKINAKEFINNVVNRD